MKRPTQEYTDYDRAFNHFNQELFNKLLLPCLITFQRKKNAYGYYSAKRFMARSNRTDKTDEIALNPDTFEDCDDKEILSTLVHEMVHHWQAHFGKPGRGRYHNREWAKCMLAIGLKPQSLDYPGKMTGQRVTHEILPGGRFDRAADQLLATDFCLNWQSISATRTYRMMGNGGVLQVDMSKTKYTCPACSRVNVWAKPQTRLVCGACLLPYFEQCEHLVSPDELSSLTAKFMLRPCL